MPSGSGALLVDTVDDGDPQSVVRAVSSALRARMVVGPVFIARADPVSGAFVSATTFDVPDEAAAAFFAIETGGDDVLPFAGLNRSRLPVGTLYSATDGHPENSARWRDVIAPLEWGDELRAAVRDDGTTWGYLCLHREAHERAFTPGDVRRLTDMLPTIAGALRRSALSASVEENRDLGTGLVLVDVSGHVLGTAGSAAEWLDELGATSARTLPLLIAGLVRHVIESGEPASSLVTTRGGRAASVEAAPIDGTGEERVAVVISAAPPEQRVDRLALAAQLTPREQEVVRCVLRGLSTRAIAELLDISVGTVQAHLTSVFSKTGVRSRRELSGRLLAGPS